MKKIVAGIIFFAVFPIGIIIAFFKLANEASEDALKALTKWMDV